MHSLARVRRALSSSLAATVVAGALLAHAPAASAATLVNTLGGPVGYGPRGSCLGRNDDGSSTMAIDIRSVFSTGLDFFGTTYNSVWINTNGSISFGGPLATYTPSAFPGAPQPMIAPFWADVDTRRSTADGFSGGGPANPACPNDTDDGVWWASDAAGGRFIVTWDTVGYFNIHRDHRMSFQLILSHPASTCGGGMGGVGNFDVEFRFNRCEWETGDASGGTGGFGGTPAQSGFDSGMASWMGMPAFVSLPSSRMAGIAAALCRDSNVMPAEPGVWRFTVRGGTVMCPNAGMACTVSGQQGVCGQGLTNCVGSGVTCVQVNQPGPERCNGLDDDCNGMTDDGMGLCGGAQICVRGVCVDHCVEGSCFSGYTCDPSGVCVETACMGMTCPAGQVCRDGSCRGACDGITCPLGQVCRSGYCVDPCNGVTCATDTVCENGVCVGHCGPCRACGAGQECASSGACVPMGCASAMCPAGQACMNGSCVDPCTGAVCPPGQACMNGSCMDQPMADAGTGDDASMLGDVGVGGDSGGPADDVAASDATSSGGDARADARRGDGGTGTMDATCACRAAGAGTGRHGRSFAAIAFGFAAIAAARRRRRRAV